MDAPAEPGPPHSARTIVLRILAALAVAGAFVAIDQIWLQDDPVPERFGSAVKTFEIESPPERLGRMLPAKVVVPKKAPPKDRSLLVFLHGRGEDERAYLDEPMFEALSGLAGRAPVVAFPFGGNSSYWHDRESGPWAQYVLEDVIPQIVDRYDIDPNRVAIGGISMGGYGAFNIARLNRDGFCAVGGHSPAIWEEPGETADGAFDDADDFERNDVIDIAGTDPSPYEDMRVWLDAGEDDPFLPGDEALEDALRDGGARPVVKRSPGGHDLGYWNGNWDEYFRFYAHALNVCTVGEEDEKPEEAKEGAGGAENAKKPEKPASGSSSRRSREASSSAG